MRETLEYIDEADREVIEIELKELEESLEYL
mgnify:CR=1 FL=1